ncbi:ATP-dependent helicase [Specibacter cremeus]|uniref:ATP-dependent helicase n=1 Tax=Specibacter cremeus TaxID=1629051 RepID=UPI000F7A2CC6|nr:ATP-dependent DNA helicase [Specibacter cremeus]
MSSLPRSTTARPTTVRPPGVRLALVPPAAGPSRHPALSADQRAIVDVPPGSGPVLAWGAPGTGKSTVLIEAVAHRVERDGLDPAGVLLLAPSRLAAARLRDGLSARLTRSLSTSPARTWSSYAFDLLRRARVEGRLPHLDSGPRLMSGPEQDQVIKDLLDGHRLGIGRDPRWPADLREALGTRGFRQEIRQLFDRVIEYGLTPDRLAALGRDLDRPDWVSAASLYDEYRDVVDWGKSGSFDPAGIITAATTLLANDPDFLARERERVQFLLADDVQEANTAVYDLLAVIAGGKDALVTASPDTVVQGFRGARPDLVGTLRERLARPATHTEVHEFVLSTSHRMGPALATGWASVADRISQTRGGHKARILEWPKDRPGGQAGQPGTAPAASGPPSSIRGNICAHVVASEVHELRLVAERILHVQHIEGRNLADIAVIVRTGAALAALQRYLSAHGIPVKVPVAENPVRDEPAVRPLLDALRICLDPDVLDAELAVALLTSRLGRSTALHLRRLRQALRRQELGDGGGRASDQLLVAALRDPAMCSHLGWEGANAARMSAMLAAGAAAMTEPGANAETVLWALWAAADCSDTWEAQALAGGPAGIRADRDLDAVMALFEAAERYVDQLPGSSPAQFLDYLLSQELPMDTLAARAQRADAVEILTPASAAGREWPVVIVAGLQEGVWPNTRLRGELLGSQLLVDVLERGAAAARQVDPATRLRETRYDELRSFAAAMSRASESLILTAVAGHDLQPSQFIDLASPWDVSDGPVRAIEQVPRPMTLRTLVPELRQESEMTGDPEAARMLGLLALAGVPGAPPEQWWGLAPLSSEQPIIAADEPVHVSPSKLDAVKKSPLNWFVRAAGGERATDLARSLGTLIHAIAQDLPEAAGHEYVAELERRWPTLGMGEGWESEVDFARAREMLRKLAQYVVDARAQGRTLIGVEVNFSVDLPAGDRTARLKGQVDRLEADADGRLVIMDLKTGRGKPTAKEIVRHPQLGAYQLAAREGAFDDAARAAGIEPHGSGGAALVPLGDGTKSMKTQDQAPLGTDTWAMEDVLLAAHVMSGAMFEARHDETWTPRSGCPLPEVCPLCAAGKQITE